MPEPIAITNHGPLQPAISVSAAFFLRAQTTAELLGVPLRAFLEIVVSRAIGVPDDQLPPLARRHAHLIPTAVSSPTP